MFIKNLNYMLMLVCLILVIGSCGNDKKSDSNENDSATVQVAEGDPAICLWSSVTIKSSPEQNGKYVTAIYLGETATFLGETAIDSTVKNKPREYVKLKLKDGTKGWAQSNFLGIKAKPYAVKNTTKLYKRPDILAPGKDQFEQMQFLVVTEEQDGWAKVKGKRFADSWFKEGWLKLENLTNAEADINTSILAERALAKETKEKKIEALGEIIDNPDLSSSIFTSTVHSLIDELSGSNTPETGPKVENEHQGD
jgi:hypothetical protein